VAVLGFALLTAGGFAWLSKAAGHDDRPNILIVLTDDQNPNMMSAMPSTLEWLEDKGVNYVNTVSTTPLCCPARASVLTGKQAHNHGVKVLGVTKKALDFTEYLPAEMREAGYTTAMAGKFAVGWPDERRPPGFDRYAMLSNGPSDPDLLADPRTAESLGVEGGRPTTYPGWGDVGVARAGLSWLDELEADDDTPWLMYLAPKAPHQPYDGGFGPAPAMPLTPALRERDLSDKPPHMRDLAAGGHVDGPLGSAWRAAYRTLRPVDDMMDRLRQKLAETDELDDTLVIFASDNGYLFGDHQRQHKREAYEASLRVPMYLAWPGHTDGGSVDRRIAGLIDIAATVYAASGVDPGYPVDGQSLLEKSTRERILIEHFSGGRAAGVVPDWSGWWRPDSMFRRNFYGPRRSNEGHSPECRDPAPTLCQGYRGLPGAMELYDDPDQTQNLTQRGQSADQYLPWLRRAVRCAGETCHELDAVPVHVRAAPLARTSMTLARHWQTGRPGDVTVRVHNLTDQPLRGLGVHLGHGTGWTVTSDDSHEIARIAPQGTATRVFSVVFHAPGDLALPAWVEWGRGSHEAWASTQVSAREPADSGR
jgi:arylsulfatase A-like enzyme